MTSQHWQLTGYPEIDSLISEAETLYRWAMGRGLSSFPQDIPQLTERKEFSVKHAIERATFIQVAPFISGIVEEEVRQRNEPHVGNWLLKVEEQPKEQPKEQPGATLVKMCILTCLFAQEAAQFRKSLEAGKADIVLPMAERALRHAHEANNEFRLQEGPSKGGKRKAEIAAAEPLRAEIIKAIDERLSKSKSRLDAARHVAKAFNRIHGTNYKPDTIRKWK